MNTTNTSTGLQLRSLVKRNGELELSLQETATPAPQDDEVVIRVEAAPVNPSDLGLMFGAADLSTITADGSTLRPVIRAKVPEQAMKSMAGRLDASLPCGNEGAGTVVAAGTSPAAQALLGRCVATFGGAMYSQFRTIKADQCLVLPEGTRAAEGASCFVNPLTALGMVETMRREGHKALVHTAAASNLGQMLNKICIKDGVPLINIVRGEHQADILRKLGARYILNSGSPEFVSELTDALAETGATIAFDAIGGGRLPGQILAAMETAINRTAKEYSRYGSTVHKQVYLYGNLDTGPTTLTRGFGSAWSIGGWLLRPFLHKIGPAAAQALRDRVVAELKTTFASHYTREVSLAEALQASEIAVYAKRATASKYLINPSKSA